MKITWLGQAGLFIEGKEATIMLDPYLSDSCHKVNPGSFRRTPIDEKYLNIETDFLLFTHNHMDHYDPETAPALLAHEKKMTVLGPTSVFQEARKNGGAHNYVMFNRYSVWTEKGFRFTAVKAEHSDPCAIGYVIEDLNEKQIIYVTGDTLYNKDIFADLPKKLDAVILPVNGVGNNMNMNDAAAFAKKTGARVAVPVHCHMFDDKELSDFPYEKKVVPTAYCEIPIWN